jgi:hypothetical protein
MRAEQLDLITPHMQAAIEELQRLIQQHYLEAIFQVEPGDDPTGMYVLATVDVENTDVVVQVYIDRLLVRGRMFRHVAVDDPTPLVGQDHEDEEHFVGYGRHHEEVEQHEVLHVVVQKRFPRG